MKTYETLFTVGQFAKLHQINKRTLQYYDDIGLFSPAHKGENGYRYYTYLQSTSLEMILTLRELNMSIEEINSYLKNRSVKAFRKIISAKTAQIDETISQLTKIRKLLMDKESSLCFCEQLDLNCIEVVDCPEEYLLLSKSINGVYEDEEFTIFMQHAHSLREHRLFNKVYGSMISAENIMSENFEDYYCFFTEVENREQESTLFVKPRGKYIRAFCKGNWDNLPNTYRRILEFANSHGITLKGYSYEVGLNEIAIKGIDEYVTQVLISCK